MMCGWINVWMDNVWMDKCGMDNVWMDNVNMCICIYFLFFLCIVCVYGCVSE